MRALHYSDGLAVRAPEPVTQSDAIGGIATGGGSKLIGSPVGSANTVANIAVVAKRVPEGEKDSVPDFSHRTKVGPTNIDRLGRHWRFGAGQGSDLFDLDFPDFRLLGPTIG